MSKLLDRFRYFKQKGETFADGHGQVMHSNRDWEDSYRQRWQFDKIVRSTHGVNCTGSCSWKIYVKNGLVTWEIQQTDYPRTRPDLPNHEPRGCPRGASYSWYLYSANRLKYPLIRKRLIELWREALKQHSDPVLAWASIMNDPQKCLSYKQVRGRGGFIRSNWQELNQLIAAANVWTIKTYGPDRVAGFSPIPAMSMVSYAAGTRYLSLLGGTCLSFYDWYCDLPPASPMTWGEQTDVPESADWYNSSYIIAWGSNVPQTRTPDAHFFTEVRYKGTKTIAITPDYSEVAKLCDQWLAPKQGTDSALAMAMGHVILKEFHLDNPSDYFINYCRRYSDMPMLVMLEPRDDGSYVPGRMVRASDLVDGLGESNNPQWKTVAVNTAGELVVPNGSIGFRWGEKGKWNLESIAAGTETELSLTLLGQHDAVAGVAFPYFGGIENPHFRSVKNNPVLVRQLPVKNLTLADGFTPTVEVPICGHATVAAHYVRSKVLGLGNCTVWQTSLAGKHRVTIEKQNDDYRISLEQGTPGFEPPLTGETRAAIINALHLTEDDILPGLPIQVATTGHSKVMIPLKPEVDIDALSPDLNVLTAISKQIGCNGFFPFQIRPGKNETDGRMFSPAIGIVEDPVTGNANGPMGAWLVHHNVLPHDGNVLRVKGHQGRALGRDGVIEVTVTIRDNQPEKVTISGTAVILFHAEWAIEF